MRNDCLHKILFVASIFTNCCYVILLRNKNCYALLSSALLQMLRSQSSLRVMGLRPITKRARRARIGGAVALAFQQEGHWPRGTCSIAHYVRYTRNVIWALAFQPEGPNNSTVAEQHRM